MLPPAKSSIPELVLTNIVNRYARLNAVEVESTLFIAYGVLHCIHEAFYIVAFFVKLRSQRNEYTSDRFRKFSFGPILSGLRALLKETDSSGTFFVVESKLFENPSYCPARALFLSHTNTVFCTRIGKHLLNCDVKKASSNTRLQT